MESEEAARSFSLLGKASHLDALCWELHCLNVSWNIVMDEQADNMNEWMNKYWDSNFPISTEFVFCCKLRFLIILTERYFCNFKNNQIY